jgi:alpha-tubulin suppressor-like RCC1 family protein
LSNNSGKLFSAGKEHGIMVDESNHIFVWGKNDEG